MAHNLGWATCAPPDRRGSAVSVLRRLYRLPADQRRILDLLEEHAQECILDARAYFAGRSIEARDGYADWCLKRWAQPDDVDLARLTVAAEAGTPAHRTRYASMTGMANTDMAAQWSAAGLVTRATWVTRSDLWRPTLLTAP